MVDQLNGQRKSDNGLNLLLHQLLSPTDCLAKKIFLFHEHAHATCSDMASHDLSLSLVMFNDLAAQGFACRVPQLQWLDRGRREERLLLSLID